jgi:hypothetical protein
MEEEIRRSQEKKTDEFSGEGIYPLSFYELENLLTKTNIT